MTVNKFLIDYKVPATTKCPPPLMIGVAGGMHSLCAGINAFDEATWTAIVSHPLIKGSAEIDPTPVFERREMDRIVDAATRTWSADGLDALLEIERGWYGDKPRKIIADAIDQQRKRVGAHAEVLATKRKAADSAQKAQVETVAPKAEPPRGPKPRKTETPKVDETKTDA